MPMFWTDSLAVSCKNVELTKRWWIDSFDCKPTTVPADWDCPLPSNVALKLPGHDRPTILLNDSAEVRAAGYERANDHPIIFCRNVSKAHDHLRRRGVAAGPIQQTGGTEFFEIHDPEGTTIEICEEP